LKLHGVGNIDRNSTFLETSELANGLGMRSGLNISVTFGKGLVSHGRDFVSQEGNFGYTENELERVQKDAIIL
jgi:hypothetical protein